MMIRLPDLLQPFKAKIFPVKAIIPPDIMALLLCDLLVLNPDIPAIVGTIKAPEKMVKAMSNDCMIECTFRARIMLNSPIISIIILVFRIEYCFSSPFDTGSPIIVDEVSKAVEPDDMTAERSAAISSPTPHSGKVCSITGMSADPLCCWIPGNFQAAKTPRKVMHNENGISTTALINTLFLAICSF